MTIGWFISMWFEPVPWYISLFAGLSCTVFGQIGDLSESLIKRDAGVKDSGDSQKAPNYQFLSRKFPQALSSKTSPLCSLRRH